MDPKEKIALVKKLRERTLLPISECTRILEEAGWKQEGLDELIKKHSGKIASKKESREMNEGKIFTHFQNGALSFVLLSCETDFVTSNEKFNELGEKVVGLFAHGQDDFSSMIVEYIAKIGENLSVSEKSHVKCNAFYLHNGKKLAAIHSSSSDDILNKKICFHIVSMGEYHDMSTVDSLKKQPWYESERQTVDQFLIQHGIVIENYVYFE